MTGLLPLTMGSLWVCLAAGWTCAVWGPAGPVVWAEVTSRQSLSQRKVLSSWAGPWLCGWCTETIILLWQRPWNKCFPRAQDLSFSMMKVPLCGLFLKRRRVVMWLSGGKHRPVPLIFLSLAGVLRLPASQRCSLTWILVLCPPLHLSSPLISKCRCNNKQHPPTPNPEFGRK